MAKILKQKKQAPKRPQSAKKPATFTQRDVELASAVKRANQRLRELEEQGLENSPAYKAVERLRIANDKAIGITKNGQVKFNTNIRAMSENERRHLAAQVNKFLNAETSTVKGYKKVADRAKQAYDRLASARTGQDLEGMAPSDWMNIWTTAIVKEYHRLYGSDFINDLIIALRESPLSYDEAIDFLTDKFGQPASEIITGVEKIYMEQGTVDSWSWDEFFKNDKMLENEFYHVDVPDDFPF